MLESSSKFKGKPPAIRTALKQWWDEQYPTQHNIPNADSRESYTNILDSITEKAKRLWEYYDGSLKSLAELQVRVDWKVYEEEGLDHTTLFHLGWAIDEYGNEGGFNPSRRPETIEATEYDRTVKFTIRDEGIKVFFRPKLLTEPWESKPFKNEDAAWNYLYDAIVSLSKELNLPNNARIINDTDFKLPEVVKDVGYKQKIA